MAKAARLVICLDNSGYEVSLERRKIYVAVPDAKAQKLGQLRVVDESGEDYLYPAEMFVEAEQKGNALQIHGAGSAHDRFPY